MSVLANVVLSGKRPAEPAATLALTYILNSSQEIARAFLDVLRAQDGNDLDFKSGFESVSVECETAQEGGRPDLKIRDASGEHRISVELKFWAGLTEAQPVDYLKVLPTNLPAALIFIVPERRVSIVWAELMKRCQCDEELRLPETIGQEEPERQGVRWARFNERVLLITSWKLVLDKLQGAANRSGHAAIEQDVIQLRGLSEKMDSDAGVFLPLRDDEVTDQELARRLMNYRALVCEITEKLKEKIDIIKHRKFDPAIGSLYYGEYLYFHERLYPSNGEFRFFLGIQYDVWHKFGITPMWLEMYDSNQFQRLKKIFQDGEDYYGIFRIPISLKTGVEQDKIVESAVSKIRDIINKIQEEFSSD